MKNDLKIAQKLFEEHGSISSTFLIRKMKISWERAVKIKKIIYEERGLDPTELPFECKYDRVQPPEKCMVNIDYYKKHNF